MLKVEKKINIIISLAILLMLGPSTAYAAITVIDAEQLKTLLEGTGTKILIDTRSRDEYREAHIPSAVNIPPDRMHAERKRLPKNKSIPLIFYCRGVG